MIGLLLWLVVVEKVENSWIEVVGCINWLKNLLLDWLLRLHEEGLWLGMYLACAGCVVHYVEQVARLLFYQWLLCDYRDDGLLSRLLDNIE